MNQNMAPPLIKGNLQKLPKMKKYFAILRMSQTTGVTIFEYYSKKQCTQQLNDLSNPKKTIPMREILFIGKRYEVKEKEKYAFSLYTATETHSFVADDETTMNEWIRKINECHRQIYPELKRYEAIFEVMLLDKGISKLQGIQGQYRLGLYNNSIDLVPVVVPNQSLPQLNNNKNNHNNNNNNNNISARDHHQKNLKAADGSQRQASQTSNFNDTTTDGNTTNTNNNNTSITTIETDGADITSSTGTNETITGLDEPDSDVSTPQLLQHNNIGTTMTTSTTTIQHHQQQSVHHHLHHRHHHHIHHRDHRQHAFMPKDAIIELMLRSIRRCGHTEGNFYLELGRHSQLGEGDLWMSLQKKSTARVLHEILLKAMKASPTNNEDLFQHKTPRSRSGSSSENHLRPLQSRSSSLASLATSAQAAARAAVAVAAAAAASAAAASATATPLGLPTQLSALTTSSNGGGNLLQHNTQTMFGQNLKIDQSQLSSTIDEDHDGYLPMA